MKFNLKEDIEDKVVIEYKDIPEFPISTVEGHAGELIIGKLSGRTIIAMNGRFHYYEGYDIKETVFPIRVFALLGIKNIISEVMPQDKEKEVSKLQKMGKKVLFVGDGINDSPALTRADVGIAVASGTDIAIESADVVLMNNNLMDVAYGISLSKAVIKNIKMNLFWAFFYNTIGIPIAAGVLYNAFSLKLNPMIGALAMSLSSVCVVTNALRLRKFKVNLEEEKTKMNTKTIYINGMQCNHCKMSVEKALNTLEEVTKVTVNLEEKKAVIEFNNDIDNNKIKDIIEEEGFEVVEIK